MTEVDVRRDPPSESPPPPAATTSSPRERLIGALSDAVRDAAVVGDVQAMKVATDALERLVTGLGGERAPVVDLATERTRRGDR